MKKNKHLKNIAAPEQIIERSKQQRAAQMQRNTSNIMLEERVKNIVESVLNNKFTPKKNGFCYFCEYKRLLCPKTTRSGL